MKNRKKNKTICRKITSLLLAMVFTALFLAGGVSVWSLSSMKNISVESSTELGETAAENAETALEEMTGEQLLAIATEKAVYIEEKFNTVIASVRGIAQLAEQIYQNPDAYPDRTTPLPVEGSRELAPQLLCSGALWDSLAEQTDGSQEALSEMRKLGNIQDLLVQYNQNNDMISSTYLATKSGWMFQADYISYSKYTQDSDIPDFYEAYTRQWYQRALLAPEGGHIYSDVIKDIHEGGDCIVCASPVYVDGQVVAVAGVGSYLDTVNEAVLSTVIGESGYAFLVNEKGQIMVSGAVEGETAADADANTDLRQSTNAALAEAADDMVQGGSSLTKLRLNGREVYLAYVPLEGLGWSFATVADVEEVLAPARESQQEILALTDIVSAQQNASIRRTLFLFLAIMLLAAVFISVSSVLFTRRITDPIRRLTADVGKLDGGNLDYRIQIASGDEVEELGNAFNAMTGQLQNYIGNLAAVTAEKERIRTELGLASRIQADMLPDAADLLPEREEFVLYASMTPAKEVGGDFYDFFFTDEDHLAFLVADVSGKGVPASLFMVVAKTLLQSRIAGTEKLEQAVTEVNDRLCSNNRNGMFVTAWIGVLCLSTGVLTYVNAGHNPPLLGNRETGFEYMKERSGFVLAGMEGTKYVQREKRLMPGDTLFLYTDGVSEANDEQGNLYGEERLKALLNSRWETAPGQLAKTVWEEIQTFQGNAEQFDDITMLIVHYTGNCYRTRIFLPDICNIDEVNEWVEQYLKTESISLKTRLHIRMAIDEMYSNICYYSGATEAVVGCRVTENEEEREVSLYFEDDGIPYNPLEHPDPDVTELLEKRREGGLGIYLVKKRMDEMHYEYQSGKNKLTLSKKERIL